MDRFDTSRPDQVSDVTGSITVVVSVGYLGLGTLVGLNYDGASDLNLTYQNGGTGTAGDKYTGLDRFGRIVETIWIKGTGDVVQSLYGHNRASSILWRKDEEASNTIAMDAYYEYDGLQQVTEWKRGNVSPSTGPPFTGVSSQKQGEDFTYDQTGNCPRSPRTVRQPDSSSGIRELRASRTPGQWLGDVSDNPNFTQSRTHNVNNQITAITGPTGVIQPVYDNAGNMTLAPSPGSWTAGYTYKWDAWNRLVEIKQGATVIGSYAYDALMRRTRKTVGGVTRDIYYDRQWRSVEEREGATVKVQHAWSPLDRWTLIRRKRNASGSTLNETLFCLRDYLDPVALANTSGAVVERYNYDAFGTVRIMSAAFGVRGNSSYDWEFLYHGEFRDKESELYNYGYRYLDTQLGRWLSRDPIGERGGVNLYGFASNNSITLFDRYGLVAPRPYIPEYETAREAIIAGGQYALQRADANLKERQVKFDQTPKEQRVGETRPTQVYEYCGLVCCTPGEDGKKMYYFAEAAGGYAVEHCSLLGAPECIKPHKVAGLYHNHPDYSSFSKADRRRSIARGVPIGVTRRHPRGHIETDIRQPNGEIEERINHDNLDSAN